MVAGSHLPVASLGGRLGRADRQGDTLQGGDTRMKKSVAEFRKNNGQTRSQR